LRLPHSIHYFALVRNPCACVCGALSRSAKMAACKDHVQR
jgi:hypothetical protein